MDPRADEILRFWFGPSPAAARDEWFRKDPAFDAEIALRFGALVEEAAAGGLPTWSAEPDSALARLLLLDQFTRNLFRDDPRAFGGDALALQAAADIVDRGWDRTMPAVRRWFVYLPFEHAEDPAAQARSLALFGQLAAEEPSMAGALDWARRHADVIARFGRFPHRNAVLGRPSTPEEVAFLRQPGSRF
jgi:uncharacterized protein (DUF924 family)